MARSYGGINVKIDGDYNNKDIKRAIADLKALENDAQQTQTKFAGMSNGMKVAGAAIAAAAAGMGYAVGRFALDAISAASDLGESQSKVTAVFKDQADEVMAWAETSATAFGQSKQQALEAAGTYGNLFQAFGLTSDAAQEMSTRMVELAADLASFNNTSIDDAIEALRSGLSGETEPLKRFGIALNDARMKSEALALGIYDGVGALTAGQKAQAAYQVILNDTSIAQGDFARTSDGLANTQRILQAAVENAKAEIGTGLVNAIVDVVDVLGGSQGMVAQIEDASEKIGTLTVGIGVVVRNLVTLNRNFATTTNGLLDFAGANRIALRVITAGVSELAFQAVEALYEVGKAEQDAQATTEAWADYRRAQQGVVSITPAVVDSLNATADAAAGAARSGAAAARALLEYAISTGQVPSAARFAQRFDVKEMLEGVGKAASTTGSSSRGAKDDVEKLDRKVKQVLPELAEVAAQFGIKVNQGLKIKGDKDFLESVKKRFDVIKERVSEFTSSRDSFQSDVQSIMSGWLSIGNAAEAYYARQKAVVDAEAELNKYRMSLTDEVTDSQKERLAELQLAYDNASSAARNGAQSIVDEFVQQSEKFGKFGEKMQQLLAAGLNKTTFRQILEMTAERGSEVADYYLNGNTQELVRRTNETMAAYNELTETIAAQSAAAFYQAGLQSVVSMLRAFIETLGTGGKARRELRSLMDSLQKELEINLKVNVPTPSGGGGGGGGPVDFTPVQQAVEQVAASIAPRPMGAYTPPLPSMGPVIPSGEGRIFAELAALNRGRAAGGPVTGGQSYLVGEIGPELFVPNVSGTIVPNKALGGSTSITINVNAGMGTNGAEVGRQIVDALKAYERRNGPVYAQA
jgi:hypothetical protein